MSERLNFETREALHVHVAGQVAEALQLGISERGHAYAALSGGSTPAPVYEKLSGEGTLAWDRVILTPADERLAPEGHGDRNETLIRRTLLKDKAAAARFVPLDENADAMPQQDVILLGMGGDGHFASLFPGAKELGLGLSEGAPPVIRVVPDPMPKNAPYERHSMSLPAILAGRRLILAITGEDKLRVLERALEAGDEAELPIRALLRKNPPQLTICWAP